MRDLTESPPPQTLGSPARRARGADAEAAPGGRHGAGGGAGRRQLVGAPVVAVRLPRGLVQPGGDAAVAGLRRVPGVAGPPQLPPPQLRPLPRRCRRLLRAPLGRRPPQPPLVLPPGPARSPPRYNSRLWLLVFW